MKMSKLIKFWLFFVLNYVAHSAIRCPYECNGKGYCNSTGGCECFPGYHGVSCAEMVCPSGVAWFDLPSANNVAHASFTECSNMGVCDRSTGNCICRSGFTGAACEQMLCPMGKSSTGASVTCSGHGRCMSLRDVNSLYTDKYSRSGSEYDNWDADMVHGCNCDAGWEGVRCDLRSCPKGIDPVLVVKEEVQLVDCTCSNSVCKGDFVISFNGIYSAPFTANATEDVIEYLLEEMSTISDVTVNIIGYQFCTESGSITQITFSNPDGDVPSVAVSGSDDFEGTLTLQTRGQSSAINALYSSVNGNYNTTECSSRGVCDHSTGICTCFTGFASSDGNGGQGTRGDCGYQYSTNVTLSVDSVTYITLCPYNIDSNNTKQFCSGRGTCWHGKCYCEYGYGGYGCEAKTCATNFSWFGLVGSSHEERSVCSGVGDCNPDTGKCSNCFPYSGDFCEYLSCPSDEQGNVCSGNGVCLTIKEAALLTYNQQKELANFVYTTPWDADMVRGCVCFRAFSIDNQYFDGYIPYGHVSRNRFDIGYNRSNFYRGPAAYSATDWIGFDCGSASCPTGLNPDSLSSVQGDLEVQEVTCTGDGGTFTLTFRENTTLDIPYYANATELEYLLEQIYTIHNVDVVYDYGYLTACSADGLNSIKITFLSEFGDLPDLIPTYTNLTNGLLSGLVTVTEVTPGTKIDFECSAKGVCDTTTGVCKCIQGYSSSNGSISIPGHRGDCSYYDKYYTVQVPSSITDKITAFNLVPEDF